MIETIDGLLFAVDEGPGDLEGIIGKGGGEGGKDGKTIFSSAPGNEGPETDPTGGEFNSETDDPEMESRP